MPSKNATTTFRIDADLRKKIEDFARIRGLSLSAAINLALYEIYGKSKK